VGSKCVSMTWRAIIAGGPYAYVKVVRGRQLCVLRRWGLVRVGAPVGNIVLLLLLRRLVLRLLLLLLLLLLMLLLVLLVLLLRLLSGPYTCIIYDNYITFIEPQGGSQGASHGWSLTNPLCPLKRTDQGRTLVLRCEVGLALSDVKDNATAVTAGRRLIREPLLPNALPAVAAAAAAAAAAAGGSAAAAAAAVRV